MALSSTEDTQTCKQCKGKKTEVGMAGPVAMLSNVPCGRCGGSGLEWKPEALEREGMA